MGISLSVIVPIYNTEEYIGRCLDSIIKQDFQVAEIICVDDGSKDNSCAIVESYKENYDIIKLISQENQGVVAARKRGVRAATGDYVAYVDSDDWIDKQMYKEMIRYVKADRSIDIVTSGLIRDYEGHSVIESENIPAGLYQGQILEIGLWNRMIDTSVFFRSNISVHINNKIYKRTLAQEVMDSVDDRINIGDDAACVYPGILRAKKIYVTGKSYYHYFMRSDSITTHIKKDEYARLNILHTYLCDALIGSRIKVPNILQQMKLFHSYCCFLQAPQYMLRYTDGVLYPFGVIGCMDRIAVFGVGKFGKNLITFIREHMSNEIVICVDNKKMEGISSVESLDNMDFDKILIAVLLYDVAVQCFDQLVGMGISKEKILLVDYRLVGREVHYEKK